MRQGRRFALRELAVQVGAIDLRDDAIELEPSRIPGDLVDPIEELTIQALPATHWAPRSRAASPLAEWSSP
tara:strand:- start:6775 stop:6987 length:213 start_codon:yes stop_codon:yes gene_type:complete